MKNKMKISIYITLLLLSVSCSKDWLDVNTDPNNPKDATPALVFPAAVASTAGIVGGQFAIVGGIWSQYYTQSSGSNQYKTYDSYNILASTFNNQFNELYSGALNDYKYVKDKAAAEQNWSYVLMATVMEAYTYQVLVDLFDQVPFREALQGEGNFAPHYDDGQLVYDSLIARIDYAMGLDFTASTSKDPGTSDYLFGGNITSWLQFANTLKLKIYLRQCYARPAVAQAGIAAIDQTIGFLSENAWLNIFVDSPDKGNPMYEDNIRRLNTAVNLRASLTLLNYLQANTDPRANWFYAPVGGVLVGLAQGDFSTTAPPANFSVFIQAATDPFYFISTAESYFLQAEAQLRGYLAGSAKTSYDAGVMAAFAQGGADGTAFLAPGGAYFYRTDTTMEAQLETIITQKWVSMCGCHGLEAYLEHNRTRYPKETDLDVTDPSYIPGQFTRPVNAVTPNRSYPKRILFTDNERQRNKNTPTEVPITTPVWWDKKSK
jgi:hypothetical protein